jgi:hypothetical protein
LTVGDIVDVRGYVTQDKYLIGRDLAEIERLLGFHVGRLALGASFVKPNTLPGREDFELAAYSMTASHRFAMPPNLDLDKLKAIASSRWSLSGGDRLVKVYPAVGHNPTMAADDQYPPGAGVPQWRLIRPCAGTVVAEVQTMTGLYKPCF